MLLRLQSERRQVEQCRELLQRCHPSLILEHHREQLRQARRLLRALSPSHLLERGFSLVRDRQGQLLRSVAAVNSDQEIVVQLADGELDARVVRIRPAPLDCRHGQGEQRSRRQDRSRRPPTPRRA
ncbi:exodeoxyribonuclease VII large subunit [Synechococcus sp. GFB01]|uniref:exodeoxyribonuclease VII large subunit n=1 Tax=Synechococcus sp. GFB01 TaxID=1662190 RepID=UPI0009080D48